MIFIIATFCYRQIDIFINLHIHKVRKSSDIPPIVETDTHQDLINNFNNYKCIIISYDSQNLHG